MTRFRRNHLRSITSEERIEQGALPESRSHRGQALKWLRKTHGWIGLWGATLGLLFGITGILQNHRAVMKIPLAQTEESTVQIPLPQPAPANEQAMADWLQKELAFDRPPSRVKSDPAKTVAWGDKSMKQPARWSAVFNSPRVNIQAEYWTGNSFVSVKRNENNLFATLNNLHKGAGVGIGWILLADTLGGSIIFLSLTGLALWTLLNRRRVVGAGILLVSIIAAAGIAMQTI